MHSLNSVFLFFASLALLAPHIVGHEAPHDYRQAHSYPSSTIFESRDGWKRVKVSNLDYKYVNTSSPSFMHHPSTKRVFKRDHPKIGRSSKHDSAKHKTSKESTDVVKGTKIGGVLDEAVKGIGKVTEVIITWYTGNDLKNPSCWSNGQWTPTDESFVCALTLEGWIERPDCFSFLELCNGHTKCIYVRVVDTCAGCKTGSHHVDLTTAAFKKLAPLDQGVLTVDMRLATKPNDWDLHLWGPKN